MNRRHLKAIICIFLTIVTLVVFWQVQNHEFINCDDPLYIVENPHVQSGLSLRSVWWSFSLFQTGPNWIPLSWLSHMVDYQLYGLNPKGHHFNNLLLHIANTLLLFIALSRMTKAIWRSAFVAALFAVHPLHVESIAWVSERKDVLSTFFWMLTLWAYARYVECPGMKRYFPVLLFFVLGLMSKPMLVTLPFVLLLLDYWPFGRLQFLEPPEPRIRQLLGLIREKIPFFIFSAALSVMTFLGQQGASAVRSFDEFALHVRIANALVAYISYIGKMIWPHNLAVFYPHPGMLAWWQVAGSFLLLLCITFIAFRTFRSLPWVIVGWLWYVGTLLPVIGLVQAGLQAMADRYTYVPIIGLFIIVSWGIRHFVKRFRYEKVIFGICGGISLLVLSICTWFQVEYWRDDITLFRHALNVTSNNHVAHNNLGLALSQKGKLKDATLHFSEALRIRPQSLNYRSNMGAVLGKQGKFNEAISHLSWVVDRVPSYTTASYNLGLVLCEQGKFEEAILCFLRAVRFKPDYAEAHYELGGIMARQGRTNEAISHYSEALRIRPLYAEAHNNLGVILYKEGKAKKAISHLSEAIRIKPDYADAHRNMRIILQKMEETGKAQD